MKRDLIDFEKDDIGPKTLRKLRLFDHAKKPDKKANKLQMMKNLDRNLAKEGKAAEVLRAEEQAQEEMFKKAERAALDARRNR